MKNFIKMAAVASLFIITALLIGACGNSAENFVQGNGKIDVTVTDSITNLALSGILIQVRETSVTGKLVDSWTTDATGKHSFQETIATDYYFTFTDTRVPAVYATQNYINNPVKPDLTSTKNIAVAMVPVI